MAQVLMEKADRLIEKEQQPVSTGRCKKTIDPQVVAKFLAKRKKARLKKMAGALLQKELNKKATARPVARN